MPAGWPTRSRPRCASARASSSSRPAPRDDEAPVLRGARYSEKFSCPYDGYTVGRARAAQLLVQLAARRVPGLHRPRDEARDRPGPRHPGPVEEPGHGRARAVGADADRCLVAAEDPRGDLRVARLGLHRAGPRPAAGGASSTSCTRRRTRRSSSATGTSAARTRTRRRSRASSPTSSGATARPIRTTSRPSSRSSWSPGRVRPAKVERLRPEILAVLIGERNVWDVSTMSITDALRWSTGLEVTLDERERTIAHQLLKEIGARLGFLVDVGLDYLTLDRTSVTLSGGEAQRIRLATQIGTTLMGVLYILDEPSIGLHQRDNAKLIATLTRLRDLGNTVLVVEHDEETIRTADWVVDIGPGAGEHGGEIIANGPLEAVLAEPRSITGAFLRGERAVPIPAERRRGQRQGASGPRRPRAQPARRRPARPARDVRRRHRRVGQRQEHARHRGPLPGPGARAQRLARAGRRPRHARGRGAHRQDHRDRPEPDRPDAALEPGHLHRPVRADPRAVRRRPGVARPRLHAGPLQLQRQGRPLRALQGRRHPQDRDAVPARRLRPVRGLQGQALQPRGARDPLQGPVDRRRPRDDDRGGARVLRSRPQRPGQAPDALRRRASATSTSASRRRPCPAARRSGSSSRPSCPGARPAGRSTSSTSRRPASTSPTSRSSSRSSIGWSTAATRSSSSSTTSTSSRPPTGSSTSARRAAPAAAGSSPRGRRRTSRRPRARRPASTWRASCVASRWCRCPT